MKKAYFAKIGGDLGKIHAEFINKDLLGCDDIIICHGCFCNECIFEDGKMVSKSEIEIIEIEF